MYITLHISQYFPDHTNKLLSFAEKKGPIPISLMHSSNNYVYLRGLIPRIITITSNHWNAFEFNQGSPNFLPLALQIGCFLGAQINFKFQIPL